MGLNLSESMCPSSDDDGMVFDDVVIRCSGEIHPKVVEGKKRSSEESCAISFHSQYV
jgi:hypothetical protein